jgi:hypothetical protein
MHKNKTKAVAPQKSIIFITVFVLVLKLPENPLHVPVQPTLFGSTVCPFLPHMSMKEAIDFKSLGSSRHMPLFKL